MFSIFDTKIKNNFKIIISEINFFFNKNFELKKNNRNTRKKRYYLNMLLSV